MSEHTPAPWVQGEPKYDDYIWAENGQMMICQVRGHGYLTGKGAGGLGLSEEAAGAIMDANKRLICAATEMLEALQNAVAYMEKTSSNSLLYHAEMMEPIRAAIAKALGE